MSFCTKCGAELPEGAAFCTRCGAPVRAPARRVSSIGEAGKLALGYLRNQKL